MLIKKIRDRQENWVGHALRSDSLLRTVWEGRMKEKKVVGRPRTKVLDRMIQETDGGTYEDLKKLAMNRKRWRTWNSGPV